MNREEALDELAMIAAHMEQIMDQLKADDMTEDLSPVLVNMNLLMLAGSIGKLAKIIATIED